LLRIIPADGLVNTSTSISAYVDFLHYLWAMQYQQMAAASYSMSLARINPKAVHAFIWGIRAIDQMLGGSCRIRSPPGGRKKAGTWVIGAFYDRGVNQYAHVGAVMRYPRDSIQTPVSGASGSTVAKTHD
jgi:hypothetical protein